MSRKRCCIVIVTHNSLEYLEGLAASLKKHVDFSRDMVVFSDNASTDRTVSFLEREFKGNELVKVLRGGSNRGFAAANNAAMRSFEADFYLLLNHDTLLLNDVVSGIISHFQDQSKIDIAGPALVFPDHSYQSSAYTFSSPGKLLMQEMGLKRAVHSLAGLPAGKSILKGLSLLPVCRPYITGLLNQGRPERPVTVEEVDWVTGACVLVSRRVFEATGGMDENIFMYGEDEEFCFRARKMGFKVHRVAAGPVVHFFGWNRNKGKEAMTEKIYESLSYVIDKNFTGRPVRRFLMKKILDMRFRNMGRGLSR